MPALIGDYLEKHRALLEPVEAFNEDQIARFGVTPQGVGWNGTEAQELRFQQLLRVIDQSAEIDTLEINDIGCGYGALYEYMRKLGWSPAYRGYDVSRKSLEFARSRQQSQDGGRQSYEHLQNLQPADYSVASGIFGMRFGQTAGVWEQYILDTLDLVDQNSRRGFSFNMLTSYSDEDRKQPELYYADPCRFFDHCKKQYSSRVSLLHDYSLFDFTIVVRKA